MEWFNGLFKAAKVFLWSVGGLIAGLIMAIVYLVSKRRKK